MSELKHTPGPWKITEDLGMDEAWCNWHKVGPFDLMGSKADADSRLISAAPDLLDALKALMLKLDDIRGIDIEDYAMVEYSNARIAISKAEGTA